jgi:proline iminopeptidase
MARFASYDGTKIGYRVMGEGPTLVCLPGGPGRASEYFGDLGGLSKSRQLVMPDTRGTGESEDAADPSSYRCDRLVSDVEALRVHLGLGRMELLGHSAAGNLAILYAAAYPERIERLILLTPGLTALGIDESDEAWRSALERRSGEQLYPDALAAMARAEAGDQTVENRRAYMPFFYGRWDDAAQAHAAVGISERARAVMANFRAEGAFSPAATREAIGQLTAPVVLYGGELDTAPMPETLETAARLFPDASVSLQPGAAHFPWIDDRDLFSAAMSSFLE